MRWPHRCSRLLLLSALWLSAPRLARADEAAHGRVLLMEQGRDPFTERVGAEIERLGFVLVRSDAGGALEDAARAQQALAAIRVLSSGKGVEVWMADATSGRSLLRQVVVDESAGGPDRDLIALQTAELLRTSLGAENSAPQPTTPARAAAPQQPTPQAPAPAAAQRTRDTDVQLMAGALYAPGGAGAAVEFGLSLQRFFSERWGLGLDVSIPLSPATLSGVEGSTELRPYVAGVAFLGRLSPRASPLFATAGAGLALLLVTYDGDARAPLRSSDGQRLMEAFYLRVDAGVELLPWLRLGVRALAGLSAQRLALSFAGNDAGNFGPVWLAGFGLLDVALP